MSGGNDDERALTRTVPSRRLSRLAKQRGELEAKVRRKRGAIERLRAEAESVSRELDTRAAAVRAERHEADEAIHAAFAQLTRDSRLGRQERGSARRLYAWLQATGAISERVADDAPAAETSAERRPDPAMRSTFLRLASAYHPDKTTDTERREQHTEIMKELNRAYRGGDAARLLELERTLGAGEAPAAELEGPELERLVASLRAQLRELSRQMSELRDQYEGVVALEHRRLAQAGCPDPVGAMLGQLRRAAAETRRLRALVAQFARREIELDALLAGPPPDHDGGDDGWLAEVFAEARERERGGERRRRG